MENIENKINAHDWIGFGDLEKWYGSIGEKETLEGFVNKNLREFHFLTTEIKVKEWIRDFEYVQLDEEGNLHRWTDGETEVVVVGLLNFWMEKINEIVWS